MPPGAPLVITVGNYLLLGSPPWSAVHGLLDEVWFVEMPAPLRVERLVTRFIGSGMAPDVARARVTHGSDAANARLVAATRDRADLVIDLAR